MQKINQTTFQLLCLLLLLFSCRRDDGIATPSEGKELKLVMAKPSSTAALNAATPVEGQEFGIYVLPTGSTELTGALESNRKFRYESGELLPAAGGDPIFYPQDGSGIDVILYSPYQEVSDNGLELDISNQDNQANLDLVYSKLINSDKDNPIGSISLHHKNSKLKFKLLAGLGMSEGDLVEIGISLSGFYNTGRFDLTSGDFSSGQTGEPISLGEKREATIFPGGNNGSGKFLFHVKGIVLSYTPSLDELFEEGKQYEYQVTVNRNLVEVKRVSTMDWQVDGREIAARTKGLEFVHIPAGTFTMGSGDTDPTGHIASFPAHQVTLNNDFLMSKYEITVGQYLEFLKDKNVNINTEFINDPESNKTWILNNGFYIQNNGEWVIPEGLENLPITNITWYGARAFALWAGGELPTEAQWEYAARAGSKAEYFFLDDDETIVGQESKLAEYAWYADNSQNKFKEVGLLKPNPWGLYDIYGNVAEYCLDQPRVYTTDPVEDPGQIFDTEPSFRGGSINFIMNAVSSTHRESIPSNLINSPFLGMGFRIIKYPSY